MPLLFALTIFVSATLLFLVQPMIAKMVLPLLGGTPAVWNTCMVFFQAVLLVGYAYAHATTSALKPKTQVLLHFLIALLPIGLLTLPLGLPSGWAPEGDAHPALWLLTILCVTAGLPFFVLSTSAPLLQKWFNSTGHPSAKDPYFLYAASNLGSMIALLGYPTIVEPNLPLKASGFLTQSMLWSAGYLVFAVLVMLCGAAVWRSQKSLPLLQNPAAALVEDRQPGPSLATLAYWTLLAFIPSSMLLGVTSHITLDVAAIPLLWILPLALYLLSFILVFARWPKLAQMACEFIMPLLILALLMFHLSDKRPKHVVILIAINLGALLATSLVCHGQLALSRPSVRHLTMFFLVMSFGGVLGGIFNALVAPVLFKSLAEYSIVLALACFFLSPPSVNNPIWPLPWARPGPETAGHRIASVCIDATVGILLGLAAYWLIDLMNRGPGTSSVNEWVYGKIATVLNWFAERQDLKARDVWPIFAYGVPILACCAFLSRPLRLGTALVALLIASEAADSHFGRTRLVADRSFFGTMTVTTREGNGLTFHALNHGTTLHGVQCQQVPTEPTGYYYRGSPIGLLFEQSGRSFKNVAIIGLGCGTMAAYGKKDMRMTIYDIDPTVVRIASDPSYFSYLKYSDAKIDIILGDARLQMEKRAKEGEYDLIVVDAFSSDAIPIHLLTREAVAMYARKLTPDGVIAIHISNRHLDLHPVVAGIAADLSMVSIASIGDAFSPDTDAEETSSDYCLVARQMKDFGKLMEEGPGETHWRKMEPTPGHRAWTDDFSNLLSVMYWAK